MNTNNTERGGMADGWEYVQIGDCKYRFKMCGGKCHAESFVQSQQEWRSTLGARVLGDDAFPLLWEERTAARDRDAALAELVATWRQEADATRNLAGITETFSDCADELEALLTNTTAHVEAAPAKSKRVEFTFNEASMMTPEEFAEAKAHPERWGGVLEIPKSVEADRQREAMRQMYEALKEIAKGACTEYRCYDTRCRPGRLAKVAVEAYEALHGTEGVKHD